MRRTIILSTATFLFLGTAAFGQLNGIPPSVTSLRPGQPISIAPPPSVTSMGPFAWQVPKSHFGFGFHSHGRFGGGFFETGQPVVAITVPAYVPYPVYPLVYPMMYPAPTGTDTYGDTESMTPSASAASSTAARPRGTVPPADTEAEADPAPVAPASASPTGATRPVATPPPDVPDQPATTLVFQDGHRLQIRNYAIVGSQIYNYSDSGPRKISLADLDLGATREINEARGVEFRIPARRAE